MSGFDSTLWTVARDACASRVAFLLVSALLLALPSATVGQEVGDRVRVLVDRETLIGRVSETSADSFLIELASGTSRSIARADILWLERDIGTGSNAIPWARKGLVRGGLGGASVGLLLGLAVGPICRDNVCDFSTREHLRAGALYAVLSAGIGGVLGGATGLALGSMSPYDDWQVVPNLRATPEGGVGFVVGVRLSF